MKKSVLNKMLIAAGLLAMVAPGISMASTIIGANIYVTNTGNVTAYFEGSDAGYDSMISVNGSSEFFPNHSTSVGTAYDLGTFAAGTLLNFKLHVMQTGDYFFSGPAANNPDNFAHAQVTANWAGTGRTLVEFEDLLGGGDQDRNDHQFSFSNTSASAVPVPAAAWLLGSGLLGLVGVARRKEA